MCTVLTALNTNTHRHRHNTHTSGQHYISGLFIKCDSKTQVHTPIEHTIVNTHCIVVARGQKFTLETLSYSDHNKLPGSYSNRTISIWQGFNANQWWANRSFLTKKGNFITPMDGLFNCTVTVLLIHIVYYIDTPIQ